MQYKTGFMKSIYLFTIVAVTITTNGCGQTNSQKQIKNNQKVGGSCEGCEAIHESPVAFEKLSSVAYLPDYNDPGPKIEISGTVYHRDGKTPAKDVVLYVYHTDQAGIYPTKGNEKGWAKRHGYIRSWIKTDEKGQYKFYTLVPASYPNSNNPKHIHPVIKEPELNEYWIDEFVFDDDPLLPEKEKNRQNPRGGSGVLKTYTKDGLLQAKRDIILGMNIPGYPEKKF